MTNATVLGMVIFSLILSGFFFTMYNVSCGAMPNYYNETYNTSLLEVDWSDIIWNSRCDGLPSWYQWIIYTPLIIIGIKSALTLN